MERQSRPEPVSPPRVRCQARSLAGGVVAISLAWLAACGGGSQAPVADTAEARGQVLYSVTGVNCVQCHGDPATLRRGAADAPALADRITSAIDRNVGRMGEAQYGYRNLSSNQLLDISAYLIGQAPAGTPPPGGNNPPAVATQCVSTGASSVRTEVFRTGLSSPWAMAFLPDGRLLVTQKAGSMRIVGADGTSSDPVSWGQPAPAILDAGQGGLLDVLLDPDFATTSWVYFTYQEPGPDNTAGTAVGRARLQGSTLSDFQRIYQQVPKGGRGGVHFGSRLAFGSDRTLFVSLGDRGFDDPGNPTLLHAQHLGNTLGKVIRIHRDGSVPSDNPFVGQVGARPEIWSYGHRNPQGLSFDPASGALWSSEHGPQGGDELNRVLPGANHGWPVRSYGCPYGAPPGGACRVGGGAHQPLDGRTFTEPVTFWAPTSMAPSNLMVYRGTGFPEWNGQLFLGALSGQQLWRITLAAGAFASCEAIPMNRRIRDVRQGPDGGIWLLADNGEILRVVR